MRNAVAFLPFLALGACAPVAPTPTEVALPPTTPASRDAASDVVVTRDAPEAGAPFGPTPATLADAIRALGPGIARCTGSDPGNGSLLLTVIVDADGHPRRAEGSVVMGVAASVVECIVDVALRTSFPIPEGTRTGIQLPLSFGAAAR